MNNTRPKCCSVAQNTLMRVRSGCLSGAHMQINIPLLFVTCTVQQAPNVTGIVVMAWLIIGNKIFTEFTGIVVLVAIITEHVDSFGDMGTFQI